MKMSPKPRRAPGSAFSLIEMLIVIAIIVILAALLVPTIAGAREKANQTKCSGNLHQWITALNLYLAEHDAQCPGQGSNPDTADASPTGPNNAWFEVLPPYVEESPMSNYWKNSKMPRPGNKSIFICPSAKPEVIANPKTYYCNYSQNLWNEQSAGQRGCLDAAKPIASGYSQYLRISQIQSMSTYAMMAEGPTGIGQNGKAGYLYGHTHAFYMGFPTKGDAFRHNGQANIAFADGHVASYFKSQIYTNAMDKYYNGGGIQWNPDNPNPDGKCP